ncbi:hypothetical protein Pth03_55640 [Planotetraspora thailandica]|uniref:DUF6745 domain-containing protein n=1 Tax=Planotetraspora thailandica TaxID=487172 RepID=A0A8J3V702_9ACTN|nr:hypothetical protein [Planotetraspora thailandica]GII57175.1 hypothetical protein Pth03_55640 [Planotetraspora thailandica]
MIDMRAEAVLSARRPPALPSGTSGWDQVAFADGAGDRAAAEDGVRRAYRDAGLAEPERIMWVGSPARGAVAAALLLGGTPAYATLAGAGLGPMADELLAELGPLADQEPAEATPEPRIGGAGASVRHAVRTGPWERARLAVHTALGPEGWSRTWATAGGRLWRPVERTVSDIRRAIAEMGGETAGELLRGATLDAVLGQHDAAWLCVFSPSSSSDGAVPADVAREERAALGGLAAVARNAGWWWPFERVALVCERPVFTHRDESGRLHRADGAAMAFPDGFALHAWRGMPVPAEFGATMASLDAGRIRAEENAELRRVMLEHYGFERYLKESGASPVHRDETGTLWRISLPGDEDLVMVEVVNSTPEPDGTHRTYFLRVPPGIQRARQGVAWTFGLTEADYQPGRQT